VIPAAVAAAIAVYVNSPRLWRCAPSVACAWARLRACGCRMSPSCAVKSMCGGGVDIRPPKYGSERTVYIPADLVQILSEHVRLHVPGDDPDRWMFPGDGDDPLHQNSAAYLWRTTRDKVGVTFRLQTYGTSTPRG
jgi:integrase